MIDPAIAPLIEQATELAVNHLVPKALDTVGEVGSNAWGWIKSRVSDKKKPMIEIIEADPEDVGTKDTLRGVISSILHDNPDALAELRDLLKSAPQMVVTQELNQSGDNAKAAQVTGNSNSVTIN